MVLSFVPSVRLVNCMMFEGGLHCYQADEFVDVDSGSNPPNAIQLSTWQLSNNPYFLPRMMYCRVDKGSEKMKREEVLKHCSN